MARSLNEDCSAFFVGRMKPDILLVSTSDRAGGAEQIACDLLSGYREHGCRAALAVGSKFSTNPDVHEIRRNRVRNSLGELTRRLIERRVRILPKITHHLSRLGDLPNEIDRSLGREPFHYPETRQLLELASFQPQIVHAHNLHRDYFDLRFLPELSARVPLVITMHDAWLLSGHCAHSFGCERWLIGCGECPDLTIPPAIGRDATAFNWQRKRDLYARSRFYVAAPSRWMIDKLERSMMAPAVLESRVISNGIDLDVFCRGDRARVRAKLNLPQEADVLLFTALSIRENIWKDYQTLRGTIARLAERPRARPLIFLAVGEEAPSEKIREAEIRFVPFLEDNRRVAEFYQAADLYIHAARADTFPTSILEALACETPVVATAVGGIPEQIIDRKTGRLTAAGDARAMADAIASLLEDEPQRRALGANAGEEARRQFGRERMIGDYLNWFAEILNRIPSEVGA
jgi:glycosyltransferase involved in cell wall biosynthesis